LRFLLFQLLLPAEDARLIGFGFGLRDHAFALIQDAEAGVGEDVFRIHLCQALRDSDRVVEQTQILLGADEAVHRVSERGVLGDGVLVLGDGGVELAGGEVVQRAEVVVLSCEWYLHVMILTAEDAEDAKGDQSGILGFRAGVVFHLSGPVHEAREFVALTPHESPKGEEADLVHLQAGIGLNAPAQVGAAPGSEAMSASCVPSEAKDVAHVSSSIEEQKRNTEKGKKRIKDDKAKPIKVGSWSNSEREEVESLIGAALMKKQIHGWGME
jgi:hypothetical protein